MHNCKECKKHNQHNKNNLFVRTVFEINDLDSEENLNSIETELFNLGGVEYVDTDLSVGEVKVFYDDRMIAPEQLEDAINQTGYKVDSLSEKF